MGIHNQRLLEIRERLQREPQVTIRELASRFAVSTMTIRRDLEKLEAQGVVVRTCGGALAVRAAGTPGQTSPSPAKQAIGRLAASLVQPGHTVLVDAGTTTLEVVRHLPHQADITLVTNSLAAAGQGAGMHVLLLGGYLSEDKVRVHGPLTEACLAQLHADILFVGCVGASSSGGFYMSDLYLTSNVRAMMQAAGRVAVVAESAKFRQRSLSCYALPGEVHYVITDDGLAAEDSAALEEQGVQVLVAGYA